MSAEIPDDDMDDGSLPSEQPTVDAASPITHAKREKQIEKEARESDEFWTAVLNSDVGRREMWKLLTDAHTFETRFMTGSGVPDPNAAFFQAGIQSFGQGLYHKLLLVSVEGIALMHREHDVRFQKKRRAR